MTTREETQQQQQAPVTYTVCDLEGEIHSITVEASMLLFDGMPADIVEVTAQQISFATKHGTVACAVDAFGQAVLGGNAPTPGDLGWQIGQNMQRWYVEIRLIERLRTVLVQVQTTLESYERERPAFSLPQARLDPFLAKVLESYKGTEESAQAIALVLDLPLERIRALLGSAAASMRAIADSSLALTQKDQESQEEAPAPAADSLSLSDGEAQQDALPSWATTAEAPTEDAQGQEKEAGRDQRAPGDQPVDGGAGGRQAFRWSSDLIKQLREEVSKEVSGAGGSACIAAVAHQVAERCEWPYRAVDYKIRALGLVGAEPGPSLPEPPAQPATQDQEDEEDRSNGSERDAQGTRETVLPGDHASSSLPRQEPDSLAFEIGNTMWDVEVDGKRERWLLDYAYGAFSFAQPNTRLTYRDKTYVLERAYTSTLKVTAAPAHAEVTYEAASSAVA